MQWHSIQILQKYPELWSKFNFEHFFNELSFGDDEQRKEILKRFADYPEHTKFDMVKDADSKKEP